MSGQYSHNRADMVDELTQKSITVATSATELFTGGSRNAGRQVIRIYNDGSRSVFIGPSGVTASGTAKGEELRKHEALSLTLGNVGIFAITSSGTCDLIISELA